MRQELLKVLVVDDELPIRQELKLFDWESCGTVLIGEASNGRSALKLCEQQVPDIIVTDIGMPQMDGLDLIRAVKGITLKPTPQFIILSCHTDFEYAQEAIRLGALDYVTKVAIMDEELAAALHKAVKLIHEEQRHIRERRGIRISRVLQKCIQQDDAWEELFHSILDELHLHVPFMVTQIVCTRDDEAVYLRDMLFSRHNEWYEPDNSRFISFGMPEQQSVVKEWILPILGTLGGSFLIIGEPLRDADALRTEIGRHMLYAQHFFYQSKKKVFTGRLQLLKPQSLKERLDLDRRLDLMQGDVPSLVQFFQNDFYKLGKHRQIPPHELRSFILYWFEKWRDITGIDELNEDFDRNVRSVATMEHLVQVIVQYLKRHVQPEQAAYRKEIRDAIRIIRREYGSSLTLNSLSERVGLNPVYFSNLFVKETGIPYHDYLTEVRMENAIQLIQHSNMKIYEVAEAVGYSNYRYFATVFRQKNGINPKSLRSSS